MEENKLVELLRLLSESELQAFGQYLSGRYTNKKVQLALYEHLSQCLIEGKSEELSIVHIAEHIMSGESGNPNKRIRSEASTIQKWLENYLILIQLEQGNGNKRLELLEKVYQERKILDRRDKVIEKRLKKLNKDTRESSDYWQLSQLYHRQYVAMHEEHMHSNKSSEALLLEAQENLEVSYLQKSLQFKCELLSRSEILNEEHDTLSIALGQYLEKIPTIKAYHLHQLLLESIDIEKYESAKSYLFEHLDKIHILDVKRCFNYLLNASAQLIRSNPKHSAKTVFDLYKEGIKHQLLINNKIISSIQFNNVLAVAAVNAEFEWAYDFIKNYQKYVDKKDRVSIVSLAKANLLFKEEKFGEITSLLKYKSFSNVGNEIRRRMLLIACEIEEPSKEDNIEDLFNSFSVYINSKKNKFSKSMKEGTRNFMKVAKKFLKPELDKEKIQSQLNNTENIYMRAWLQDYLDRYKS